MTPTDREIAELCDKLALVIRESEHPGGWMRREVKVKIGRELGELLRKRFGTLESKRAPCPCGSLLHERCYGNCKTCGSTLLTEDKRCPICEG